METLTKQKQPEFINVHSPRVPERTLYTDHGVVYVEGPVSPERIRQFTMSSGLCKFRQPREQHLALADIANLPEGLVFIAHSNNEIIAYVTFHYPEFERWAQSSMPCLVELGAIEVSKSWRGFGISSELIQIPFDTELLEDKIILSMECHWFWDLQNNKLSVWEYRKLMENLMGKSGFVTKLTDDPDIASHPANLLSVRFGNQVNDKDCLKFESLCFCGKWLF